MAQQLQSINIGSPGFFGLNSEDSPVGLDTNFASVADNAIIDRYGRLGARKGFDLKTVTRTPLSDGSGGFNPITELCYFEDSDGNNKLFGAGNSKLWDIDPGTGALTDVTPGGLTVNDDNWRIVTFNNGVYFFQRDHAPYYYTDTLGALTANTDAPEGGVALSAFGRLWVADFDDDKSTIYWSDLLVGTDFTGGSSGSIDISKVWPDGYDEITALAAYNDFLVIFGRDSIVVYSGADSPANMVLSDTISGVGCISWRTVQETGNELLYLSRTGLRSFNRTVQGGALPVSDVSNNIRKELVAQLGLLNTGLYDSMYYPEESLYIVTIRSDASTVTYSFDLRGTLEDGTLRCTRWPATPFYTMHSHQGVVYCGNSYGMGYYNGYQDKGPTDTSYRFKFYSVMMTAGQPDQIKMLKQIRFVVISRVAEIAQVYWGYGFSRTFQSQTVPLRTGSAAEFNVAEFSIDEFAGGVVFSEPRVKPFGSGRVVTIGFEADIDGGSLSIQEINVQTLLGRLQ